jgi:hypothetical protein
MKLNIDNKRTWQIGSGDSSRDYSNVFLEFGVALVGPGDPGDDRNSKAEEYYKGHPNENNWGSVLRQVQPGHWIILRSGQRIIKAVGEVTSGYDYKEIFGDVDGWDLQHLVNVNWYLPVPEKGIVFDKSVLVRSTLAACRNEAVIDRIKTEDFIRRLPTADYRKLKLPQEITMSDIYQSLIDFGIRIQDAENVAATIERIIKLTKWYLQKDPDVLEHEIRTFLVVPLLISLGWSEQKIKIEYNKIDVAIFKKPFVGKYETDPDIIIETKRFYDGLSFTKSQAEQYSVDYPTCKVIIATNGYRYKIFEKQDGNFVDIAYLNMANLREHHYLNPEIGGAVTALLKMSSFN